jgi:hypothetical protein
LAEGLREPRIKAHKNVLPIEEHLSTEIVVTQNQRSINVIRA